VLKYIAKYLELEQNNDTIILQHFICGYFSLDILGLNQTEVVYSILLLLRIKKMNINDADTLIIIPRIKNTRYQFIIGNNLYY
jgi:hypothetical protein